MTLTKSKIYVILVKTKGGKMIIQVEGVEKENRKYFKGKILEISQVNNVAFADDDARIETKEPFIATEETLKEKSEVKEAIYQAITDFRQYQFNQ
jgi:hypothetical protein